MKKVASAEINQAAVNRAFRELDWPALETHLRSVRLGSAAQQILVGLARRADALIIKRLDPARRAARDEFASRFVGFIQKSCGPKVARTVDRHLESIKRIDGVYASILALVDESDAAKLTPALRIAALLSRSAQEHQSFMRDVFAYNEAIGPEPFTAKGITAAGTVFDSDAVRDAMIAAIGSTVLMEAYTHSWFDAAGMVCLPQLPLENVSDGDRFCVGRTQMLAATWWKWEQTERRARYGGGELHWYDSHSLPDWARRTGAEEAVELKLNVRAASIDRIANQRLFHKMEQNFLQLMVAGADKKAAGIDGVVPLLPDAFVSASEVHAADALHSALSYDLIGDTERIKGVRLVEWLRGYATLHEFVRQRVTDGDPSTEVLLLPKVELISLLTNMGLVGGIAERFIDAVTFSKSSRDLYDNPLIKCGEDYVVFAPVISHLNIARAMLSAVSMHGAKLKKKGQGFEQRVRDLIDRNGHKSYAFKAKRGDEEYEVDAMFVWGDRAFLLECKNRTLSGNHPVPTHYFELETRSHAAQVNRILNGLRLHPDILATHCPAAVGKRIVACVVNAPPFSLPGGMDGIYMTDFSALHRFFEDPYLGVFAVADGDTNYAQWQAPNSAVSMWKSETGPTPDDLEEMMRLTPQFELHEALLSVTHTDVQYSHTGVFRVAELQQQDINADTVSAAWRKIGRPTFNVVAKRNTSGTGTDIGPHGRVAGTA